MRLTEAADGAWALACHAGLYVADSSAPTAFSWRADSDAVAHGVHTLAMRLVLGGDVVRAIVVDDSGGDVVFCDE